MQINVTMRISIAKTACWREEGGRKPLGKRMRLTSFCPVVTSSTLPKDEVVRSEEVAERTRSDRVHSSRLQVDEYSARNILVGRNLVVVDVDAFELEVVGTLVNTVAVDTVFV